MSVPAHGTICKMIAEVNARGANKLPAKEWIEDNGKSGTRYMDNNKVMTIGWQQRLSRAAVHMDQAGPWGRPLRITTNGTPVSKRLANEQ